MSATVLSPPARETSRRAVPMWLAVTAASLPMLMAALDNLVLTNALPVIRVDLRASVTELSWFMNAFTLTFASFMLIAANLGDRLGRRRVMLSGIALFTLASISGALATAPAALIVSRAIQGVGAAAITPLSLTLLASAVPERLRSIAIGIWSGVSGLGVALGPVVGGAVVEGISWQAIFWLNVPVAVIAIPLLRFAIPESRAGRPRLDAVGTILLGGAVFLGIWGIVHGNTDGWATPSVLMPLVGSALLVPGYLLWARRRIDAVLPLRLFASANFSATNAISLLFSLGMFGAAFLLAQYLQVVIGYSPLAAGLHTLPWTAAPMVIAPLAGVLARRVGVRPLLLVGLLAQTASLVWFAIVADGRADYPPFVAPLVLAGIGMGLTFAPVATALLDGLPSSDFAIASSANATLREFGVAIGIAVLVAVFLANGGTISPTGYDGAIAPALLTGAAALGTAAIAALFIPARCPRSA